MSAHETTAAHGPDGHGAHESGEAHGSLGGYLTGFVLSVILTAIPFWLVMSGALGSATVTAFAIMGFAMVQIVVHMIYFLHMSFRSEGGWSLLALGFTLILVVITLSGSLWVMYHLNTNMMPSMHEMRRMP
ncbi:cytochrome o ubiquinol oxidase subunit IV [Ancylobacter dichloromethanicus]|uniref:Cytochrome bo(3) ubiquinol oxidase subunit 4 n=1 Tax=Ancylobacter dichloromethanicus TaxID=518825 RepID=A0A9W6JC66_9HYPH|nr:cytochrome o ubiquinol oxidase subunit IV [Ancylobacter dichloromethanicus]MBS7554940.1 cytochrome o ubiquinol oxidase subunit IV [Ancylobacter dichloromethanicus]GLK73334.1 cytochrome o ubiquinol oxidase subunit IV [Ancylobacter dichloromethanicus]